MLLFTLVINQTLKPKVPESLAPLYDQQAQIAHERMAAKSLSEHLKEMPLTQEVELDNQHIRFAELKPRGDYDNSEATLLSLPYANGWAPHMYLRARYLQDLVAPDQRLIVLPQNTLEETAYDFTDEQLAQLKEGNIRPIIERQARLAVHLGIGRASLIGYSFGGMNVAALSEVLADEASILSVGAFEAPNVVDRTSKQLSKDFKSAGLDYLKAAQDANIPALTDALGKNPYSPKVIKGLLSFGISSLIKGNKEVKEVLAENNLSSPLASALTKQPNLAVLLANAEHSKIAPTEAVKSHADSIKHLGNVKHITVEDYGHGMGDNIVIHGLLGKAAVQQAKR